MEQGDDARPLLGHMIVPGARRESDWVAQDTLASRGRRYVDPL
jgi:hypothetical protein